jgi:outer membrane receptor protein involved in Fe transport
MIAPHTFLALVLAASDTSRALPDTALTNRVVRRLEEIVVRASPLHDPLSSQTVQIVTRAELGTLPIDRLVDVLALKAGVVAQGEELHVRGGRAGETQMLLRGMALNDALRGRAMELPLLAVESVELATGGLDPEHGGALAGVAQLRTIDPGDRWSADARWESDGGLASDYTNPTRYNRVSARAAGPVVGGVGMAVAADVLGDDTYLPALRTRLDARSWRADNRILGFAKIASTRSGAPLALEVLGSRRMDRPYNPIWSLDGFTTPCSGFLCSEGPAFSPDPLPGYQRFRGADHAVMTDEHRLAAVLSGWRPLGRARLRGAASWVETRRLTSVGGRDDDWYLDPLLAPLFGYPESPNSDPIFVYYGYEPFYQRSTATTWGGRADYDLSTPTGNRAAVGAGLSYDHVTMREIDATLGGLTGLDSLRSYEAFAPGGFAYAQGRWIHQGMVLNGGLRLDYFTAGPQADDQSFGGPARGWWSLAPRAGIAYPVSTRDVLSFAYVRIEQPPPRDFLYENRDNISGRRPLGNPGLEPSTVISYQASLKHLFDAGRAFQVSFFYRDLFGQIGARPFETRPGFLRRRYANADEGHAEGFELGLFLPTGSTGRVEVQYTFMHAVGTASEPEGFPYGPVLPQRIDPIGDVPLDWDRRHSIALMGDWQRPTRAPTVAPRGPVEAVLWALRGSWSVSWATRVGSALPWTPSLRNVTSTDPARVNAARFKWEENTSLALRWSPALARERLSLGLDVRNAFDYRSERAATLSGYPLPAINTVYDDDGAFRDETGLPGGAYWDGTNRDPGSPTAWVRIHDPRLFNPPRMVRFSVSARW